MTPVCPHVYAACYGWADDVAQTTVSGPKRPTD